MATYSVAVASSSNDTARKNAKLLFLCMVAVLILFALTPHAAFAADNIPTTGATGDSVWSQAKGLLFSGWGMIWALIIVLSGGFIWARRGIGEGIIVMASGFSTFFLPAIIVAAMAWGKSLAA
jgi:hypothetical protein